MLPLVLGGAGDRTARALAQQLSLHEFPQGCPRVRHLAQLFQQGSPHDRTTHGRVVQDPLLVGGQTVETSGDHETDRGRHLVHRLGIGETPAIGIVPNGPMLDEHADHLLQEQRVAVGSIDGNADAVGRAGFAEQRLRQRPHRRDVESRQRRRRQPRDRLPRQAEQQHRRRPRVALGVGEQFVDRGVGPLEIVEHDRDGPEPRGVLDHEPGRTHDVAVAAPRPLRIVHTEQGPQVLRHRDVVRPRDPPGHAIDRRTCDVEGRAGPHTERARNDLRERGQPSLAERGASAQEEPTGCK